MAVDERLERLLRIADVLEKYEYFLLRRSIGNLYIGVISIVATSLVIYFSLAPIYNNFIAGIIASVLCVTLLLAYYATVFKFSVIIKVRRDKRYSIVWLLVFLFFSLLYMAYPLGIELPPTVFPVSLALTLGLGNIGCYFVSNRSEDYPGKIKNEYLVLGSVFVLTSFLLVFVNDINIQWLIDIVVIWVGMILFGVYVSLTAYRIFEEG